MKPALPRTSTHPLALRHGGASLAWLALACLSALHSASAGASEGECSKLLQGAEAWASSPEAYQRIQVSPPRFNRPKVRYDRFTAPSGQSFVGTAEVIPQSSATLVEYETEIQNPDSTTAGRVLRGVETAADGSQTVYFASASADRGRVVTSEGERFTLADYATLRQLKAAGVTSGSLHKAFANQITNRRTQLELLLKIGRAHV